MLIYQDKYEAKDFIPPPEKEMSICFNILFRYKTIEKEHLKF